MSILTTWITSGHLFTIGELSDLWGGWLDLMSFASVTFAYSSADSPTFVMSSNVDLTGILQPGMRVRIKQAGGPIYFIVTAVSAYAAGSMTITLLAPNDGTTLANSTITACAFSSDKAPFGFPGDPTKWVWTTSDTAARTQTSPASGTWYNPGSLSLVVPIGAWRLSYDAALFASIPSSAAGAYVINVASTLSTANNSESDVDMTVFVGENAYASTTIATIESTIHREKPLTLAVKTTYFLNAKTGSSVLNALTIDGAASKTFIRAESRYL